MSFKRSFHLKFESDGKVKVDLTLSFWIVEMSNVIDFVVVVKLLMIL